MKRLYLVVRMQSCLDNLRGPVQNIKVGPPHDVITALIEYLTVLLEYINLIGPLAEWGPGQNAPVAPPLSVALVVCNHC